MRVLLAALLMMAGAASAQGRPAGALSADEIRDLARRDMVWCENHRVEQNDCETMTLVSLSPDGTLQETGLMRLSQSPDLRMVIDGKSRIQGNAVCSVYGDESVKLRFLLNGRPLPASASGPLEGVVREAMAEFQGKTLCQTFFRGASESELREQITVNGARRPDLESTYRLQPDEKGLDVRPTTEDAEESIA